MGALRASHPAGSQAWSGGTSIPAPDDRVIHGAMSKDVRLGFPLPAFVEAPARALSRLAQHSAKHQPPGILSTRELCWAWELGPSLARGSSGTQKHPPEWPWHRRPNRLGASPRRERGTFEALVFRNPHSATPRLRRAGFLTALLPGVAAAYRPLCGGSSVDRKGSVEVETSAEAVGSRSTKSGPAMTSSAFNGFLCTFSCCLDHFRSLGRS